MLAIVVELSDACIRLVISGISPTQRRDTMRLDLTSGEEILLTSLLESEYQQWQQALYTISLETSDKTFKGLCEKKIQEIEDIKKKMKETSKQ